MLLFNALEWYIAFTFLKAALSLCNFQAQTWSSEVRRLTGHWFSSYRTHTVWNTTLTLSCALLTFSCPGNRCSFPVGMEVHAVISHKFPFACQCCQPGNLFMLIITANFKNIEPCLVRTGRRPPPYFTNAQASVFRGQCALTNVWRSEDFGGIKIKRNEFTY